MLKSHLFLLLAGLLFLGGCMDRYEEGGEPNILLTGLTLSIVQDEETQMNRVRFPNLDFGESFRAVFEIQNNGTGTLEVGQITVDNGDFRVEQDRRSLAPNESMRFTVIFEPKGFGEQRTTLAFLSNDAEQTLVQLELVGGSNAAPQIAGNPVVTLPNGLNTEVVDAEGELGTLFYYEFELDDPANVITDEVELVIRGEFSNGTAGNIVKTTEGTERERVTFTENRMGYYMVIRFGASTYVDFEIFLRFPDGRTTQTITYRQQRPDGAN